MTFSHNSGIGVFVQVRDIVRDSWAELLKYIVWVNGLHTDCFLKESRTLIGADGWRALGRYNRRGEVGLVGALPVELLSLAVVSSGDKRLVRG